MYNSSNPGQNAGDMNHPAHLAGAKALSDLNKDEENRDEDTLFEGGTPEAREGRSEADKEAETRPEDFESFNVDKVDDLQRAKEESDGPGADD